MLIKFLKGILTIIVGLGIIALTLAGLIGFILLITYVFSNPIIKLFADIFFNIIMALVGIITLLFVGLTAYALVDDWLRKLKIIK